MSFGCAEEERMKTTCDSEMTTVISDQIGRIYQWTNSEPYFYYIGNPTEVPEGVNGGYIPCGELNSEFRTEGMRVKYSGIYKGSMPDTGDPLLGFIVLTKIEELRDN